MKRVWLAICVSLISYCLVDILIWQRVFEDNLQYTASHELIAGYQVAWQIMLSAMIIVGCIGFWKEKPKMFFFAIATVTLAHSGLEDILYYWLDGKQIPAVLPWLDKAPLIIKFGAVTSDQLLLSAGIWIVVWLIMTMVVEALDG